MTKRLKFWQTKYAIISKFCIKMKLIMLVDLTKLNQHAPLKSLKEQAAKMLPLPWKYQGKNNYLIKYLIKDTKDFSSLIPN